MLDSLLIMHHCHASCITQHASCIMYDAKKMTSKMKTTSKMKMTLRIMRGGGLNFQAMFTAPNTSKSCIWHSIIANWNYSRSGRLGSGRVGPIVIITLSQPASRAGALAWLSLAMRHHRWEKLCNAATK